MRETIANLLNNNNNNNYQFQGNYNYQEEEQQQQHPLHEEEQQPHDQEQFLQEEPQDLIQEQFLQEEPQDLIQEQPQNLIQEEPEYGQGLANNNNNIDYLKTFERTKLHGKTLKEVVGWKTNPENRAQDIKDTFFATKCDPGRDFFDIRAGTMMLYFSKNGKMMNISLYDVLTQMEFENGLGNLKKVLEKKSFNKIHYKQVIAVIEFWIENNYTFDHFNLGY